MPRKKEGDYVVVTLVMDRSQLAALKELAAREGASLSAYVRRIVAEHLARAGAAAAQPQPAPQPAQREAAPAPRPAPASAPQPPPSRAPRPPRRPAEEEEQLRSEIEALIREYAEARGVGVEAARWEVLEALNLLEADLKHPTLSVLRKVRSYVEARLRRK